MLTNLVLAAIAQTSLGATFELGSADLHPVDPRLFGYFMERPSWGGEIGVEAAVLKATGKLDARVERMIAALRPPVIRFPHGTDLDYVDWRDMVDNVPGRSAERPLTPNKDVGDVPNRFGFDEFLQLCERTGAEPIIPVRFRSALLGEAGIEAEAEDAARLVAYCVGDPDRLAGELADWARLRVKNGRAKPYRVPYWQIGNEIFVFWDETKKRHEDAEARYVRAVGTFAKAIRKVQPDAQVLADAISPELNLRLRKEVGDDLAFLVEHWYRPWEIQTATRNGQAAELSSITPQEAWYAWTTPTDIDPAGQAVAPFTTEAGFTQHRYPLAVTEWNWNGWWKRDADPKPLDSDWAKGLGAATYVHALIRAGATAKIACQSMMVGRSWGITAIHVDGEGAREPWFMPTGQVVEFAGRFHRGARIDAAPTEVPVFSQPLAMNAISAQSKVLLVDAVATRSGQRIGTTVVQRHFDTPVEVRFRAPGQVARASARVLERGLENGWGASAVERDLPVKVDGRTVVATVPARSMAGFEIELL